MSQPRFPKEFQKWKQYVEQLLIQHHVDIQRLWKRMPQTPNPAAGIPVTGPAFSVGAPLSGSGSTSTPVSGHEPPQFQTGSFGPYQTGSGGSGGSGGSDGTPNTGGSGGSGGTP